MQSWILLLETIRQVIFASHFDLCIHLYLAIQSINVIESPHLRRIFLMLREDLLDSDIPHSKTIRERLLQVWESHLKTLSTDMNACLTSTLK